MDPTQSGGDPSTFQTLASVLAGGLAGYVDAQNHQPVAAVQPLPQTAYGYQGTGQATPSGSFMQLAGGNNMLLFAGIAAVVLIVLFKK